MTEGEEKIAELRRNLRNAAIELLEANGGDTYAIESEIAEAVFFVTGKFCYCDIHG